MNLVTLTRSIVYFLSKNLQIVTNRRHDGDSEEERFGESPVVVPSVGRVVVVIVVVIHHKFLQSVQVTRDLYIINHNLFSLLCHFNFNKQIELILLIYKVFSFIAVKLLPHGEQFVIRISQINSLFL